jgi:cation transport ATPase
MDYYFHHIPGRLRVKSPLLKKNQHLISQVERLLNSIHGVTSITANLVTGSVVIQYDPQQTSSDDILHTLTRAGYFDRSRAVTHDDLIHHAFSKTGKAIASVLFGAVIQDQLEGSPLSVIAALI